MSKQPWLSARELVIVALIATLLLNVFTGGFGVADLCQMDGACEPVVWPYLLALANLVVVTAMCIRH
jgi:hypothetical protein